MTWSWWQQGGEIAALRTDLQAAYAEVEALRARPEVVSPPASADVTEAGTATLVPGADAPDAATIQAGAPLANTTDSVAARDAAASTSAAALTPAPPAVAPPEAGAGANSHTRNAGAVTGFPLDTSFRPRRWLRGPHFQTILPGLPPRRARVEQPCRAAAGRERGTAARLR
jgi:hypothetical protein